jgi:putative ABC transport system permease protein
MFKLTVRGLVAHKLRFLLTGIAVVLGVAFVSGTLVFTDTVKKTFDELFESVYDGTDALVRNENKLDSNFGPAQRERIPQAVAAQVREVDGVAAADGVVQIARAQYLDRLGDTIGNPAQGSPTLGSSWTSSKQLNPYTLVPYEGKQSSPPTAANEVVMDLGTAKEANYGIGDTVTIIFNNQDIPRADFTVVGISKFGDSDRPAGATVALFTLAEAQRLNGAIGELDGVAVAAEPGVSQTELVDRIRASLDDPELQVITGEKLIKETQDEIQKNLSFFNIALLIFAAISVLVGAFIIVNTFSIVIAQRTRELALLRALGASGGQVRSSVFGEALLVGAFSSVIGFVAGIGLAVGLRGLMSAFGFDVPTTTLVIKPATFVIAMVVGVGVTFVSAVLPARRAARIPPIAALREVAVEQRQLGRRTAIGLAILVLGAVVLVLGLFANAGVTAVGAGVVAMFIGVAVLGPVIARPSGRLLGAPAARWRGVSGQLARENAVRNPRRTASTAAALMIGVALVGLITIFAASFKASIGGQIDRAFRADLLILPEAAGPGGSFSPALAEDVREVPGVEVATPIRFSGFEVDGSSQFVVGLDPSEIDAVFDVDPQQGDLAALGPDQIAVSRKALEDNKWKLGDEIDTKFPIGGDQKMEIGAVYGFGQREGLSDYQISLDAYDKRFTEIVDNQLYITLAPGADAATVKADVEKILKQFPGTEISDRTGLKDRISSQINQLLAMVFALLALAIVIALLGIINTLLLSIVERTREIGLLRAVGMSRRQVRSSVRWESVIVAVFGAVLGLLLGIFFGWTMVRALNDEGITDLAVPFGQLIVIVVFAAVLGVLAAVYPAHRAAKLDVLDAISTE